MSDVQQTGGADRTPYDVEGSRKRRNAVIVLTLACLALGGYGALPHLLPVYAREGPLITWNGESWTVAWYLSKPVDGVTFALDPGDEPSVERDGLRCTVRVAPPESDRAFVIRRNDSRLAEGELPGTVKPTELLRFIVFGDSGEGNAAQRRLAERINAESADFLLHTGDLVYPRGARREYDAAFFGPYAPTLASTPFYPCIGNHDVSRGGGYGRAYRAVFDLPSNGPSAAPPEHHYYFDFGPARIAVIDSNATDAELRDVVAPWLKRVFSVTPEERTAGVARWRFVSLHHPPYTAGSYEPDAVVRRTLVPTFEAAGVDMVFSGHDHNYQRTAPLLHGEVVQDDVREGRRGIVYVVTGAGGAELYDLKPPDARPAYVRALYNEQHSFTIITLLGDTLKLRQINADGAQVDSWSWRK